MQEKTQNIHRTTNDRWVLCAASCNCDCVLGFLNTSTTSEFTRPFRQQKRLNYDTECECLHRFRYVTRPRRNLTSVAMPHVKPYTLLLSCGMLCRRPKIFGSPRIPIQLAPLRRTSFILISASTVHTYEGVLLRFYNDCDPARDGTKHFVFKS